MYGEESEESDGSNCSGEAIRNAATSEEEMEQESYTRVVTEKGEVEKVSCKKRTPSPNPEGEIKQEKQENMMTPEKETRRKAETSSRAVNSNQYGSIPTISTKQWIHAKRWVADGDTTGAEQGKPITKPPSNINDHAKECMREAILEHKQEKESRQMVF